MQSLLLVSFCSCNTVDDSGLTIMGIYPLVQVFHSFFVPCKIYKIKERTPLSSNCVVLSGYRPIAGNTAKCQMPFQCSLFITGFEVKNSNTRPNRREWCICQDQIRPKSVAGPRSHEPQVPLCERPSLSLTPYYPRGLCVLVRLLLSVLLTPQSSWIGNGRKKKGNNLYFLLAW